MEKYKAIHSCLIRSDEIDGIGRRKKEEEKWNGEEEKRAMRWVGWAKVHPRIWWTKIK